MEVCWLYALLAVVETRAHGPGLSLPAVLVFYPLAYGLHRFLLAPRGKTIVRQSLSWVIWVIAAIFFAGSSAAGDSGLLDPFWIRSLLPRVFALGSFPSPEFLAMGGSALLWGCGMRLARLSGDGATLLSEFQFGTFMLLVVFFLDAQWKLNVDGLVPLTFVFFLFALTGLPAGLLRIDSGRASKRRNWGWISVVIGVVCIVLAAGLLAASLLKPELLNQLLALAEAAARLVGRLIAKIFAFLASILPNPEPPKIEMVAPPAGMERDPSFIAKVLRIPESVRSIAAMIVSAIWIVLFLAALWSLSSALVKWLLQRMSNPNGAEIETLSGAFREDLYALMKSLVRGMDRFFSLLLGLFGIKRIRKALAPDPVSARSVYRQLLRWSARKGCGRQRAQTPGEYLDVLLKRMPAGSGEFSLITSGYIEERYGPVPAAPERLEMIRESWKRVKTKNLRTAKTRSPQG
jgi:hypothetical protein